MRLALMAFCGLVAAGCSTPGGTDGPLPVPESSIVVPEREIEQPLIPTVPGLKGHCEPVDVVAAVHEIAGRVDYDDPTFGPDGALNYSVSAVADPICGGKAARVTIYSRQDSAIDPFISCITGRACELPGPTTPVSLHPHYWSCIEGERLHLVHTSQGDVCLDVRLLSETDSQGEVDQGVVLVEQQPIPCFPDVERRICVAEP